MKKAYDFNKFARGKLGEVYKPYTLAEAFKPGEDGMPSIPTVCVLSITSDIAIIHRCVTKHYIKSPDAIVRYFMYLDKISDNTLKYIVRFVKAFLLTDIPKDFSDVEPESCTQIFLLTFLMMKYNEGKNLKCDERLNKITFKVTDKSEDNILSYVKSDTVSFLTMLAEDDSKVCFDAVMSSLNNCLLSVDTTRAEMNRIKNLARYFLITMAMEYTREEVVGDAKDALAVLGILKKQITKYDTKAVDKLSGEKDYLVKENAELKEKIAKLEKSDKVIDELQQENLKLVNLNVAYERKLAKARYTMPVKTADSINVAEYNETAANGEKVISDNDLAKYNITVVATKDRVKKASWFKLADVAPAQTSPERIAGSDLVIICTSFISHPIFYRVREYCKRYNIKYIYNPDQIINQDRMIESIRQSAIIGLGL